MISGTGEIVQITDSDEVARLRLTGPDEVALLVSEGYADELLLLAREEGLRANREFWRFHSPEPIGVIVAVLENPAAWAVIGLAVKKFFDRHKGKRVRFDGNRAVEVGNYSARDIERILRAMADEHDDTRPGKDAAAEASAEEGSDQA